MKKLLLTTALVTSITTIHAETIQSPQIVITGTKYPSNSFDIPASIDVIDYESLSNPKFTFTPAQDLNRVSGLNISDPYSTDIKISSRGFGAKSNIATRGIRVYQDGIPLNFADGLSQTSVMDLNNIDRIEVLKGPLSTMYGSLSGGVVQFFTQVPKEKNKVESKFMTGSFGTQEVNTKYSGIDGSMKYLVSHTDYSTDGYKEYSKLNRDQTTGKLWFNPSEYTNILVSFKNSNQTGQDWGNNNSGITADMLATSPRSANEGALNISSWKTIRQTDASIKVDHFITKDDMVSATLYGGVRSQEQINPTTAASTLATTSSGLLLTDRKFYGTDLRYDHSGMITTHPYKISTGITYMTQDDVTSTGTWMTSGVRFDGNTLTRSMNQIATSFDQYVQGQVAVTKSVDLHAGIRRNNTKMEFIDKLTAVANGGDNGGKVEYSNTSPAVGITWKATPSTNLYASYGKGIENPSFNETQSSAATATSTPNTTIVPQKSDNYEAGIKSYVLPNTYLTAALYQSKTKDEIILSQSSGGFRVFTNSGDTTRKGVEFSLNSALPYGFGLYGNYSYIDAKFDTTGLKIPGVAENNAFGELSWKYDPLKFKVSSEVVHAGKVYATADNSVSADSYTIYNMRAGFTQKISKLTIQEFASINNISDKTYSTGVNIDAPYGRYYQVGAPRNYMLGVSASYSF
jgi:iron complex outermembrane receptor protein